jgi:hypothetical protein
MEDALKQKQEVSVAIGETVVNALAAIRRLVAVRKAEAICGALLLLMAINLLASISRKSITNDEVVHIPAGYYHLVAGKFQLNNEHPPLIKMWAALPLLFIQPNEPQAPPESDANFMEKTWAFHEQFWQANRALFSTITFWARVMMIPITLALAALIFVFARRFFGSHAAIFAVALYSFEPTILGHGRIVHTDVPAAFAYLLFFFTLYIYANAATWKNALKLGLVSALALLTKFSMIVLLPVLALCLLVRLWQWRKQKPARKRVVLHAIVVAAIIIFCVNAAYRFSSQPLDRSDVHWLQIRSTTSHEQILKGINVASHVIPTYFLFGIYNVAIHNKDGHAASLLGDYRDLGWWYYFPIAFALKTTLPFLLVAITGLLWSLWELIVRREWKFLWLIIPLAIYLTLSVTGHINIGIRHLLPAFPFLFILGGAMLDRLLKGKQKLAGTALVVIVFGWSFVEAARVFPDYIPYMNQLASGRPHWWYLSDSNVEWGDDVGALAQYLRARGETRVRGALSAGWSTLTQYGIEFISLAPPDANPPDTRYVAIGASYLNGATVPYFVPDGVPLTTEQRVNYFDKYRHRTPEAVFGGSIYLYREHE